MTMLDKNLPRMGYRKGETVRNLLPDHTATASNATTTTATVTTTTLHTLPTDGPFLHSRHQPT